MNIIKEIRKYRLFSINIASYRFSPGIFSTLVTAAFLYTMMSLGFWQLDRADFKDTLQQKIEQRKNLSAVGLDDLPVSSDDRRYLPVIFNGTYDTKHNFLLDNKTFKGRVGYHVYTPFKVSESKAVLISRGFIELGKSRDVLPEIVSTGNIIELQGLLDLPPSRALLLAENVQQTERWPVVLQYIDLDEIGKILGYELYDMVIWLDENANNATNEDKKSGYYEYDLPVLNLNAAKNNGYAFQWFVMTLALFIIYIVVNTKKEQTE